MNRRQLLAAMGVAGAAGALYVLRLPSSGDGESTPGAAGERPDADRPGNPQLEVDPEVDYGDWIHIGDDGVTVYSGRTEIGQGFRTVLVALLAQGLTVDPGDVEAVLGDTDRCPDDGPTAGSCSTRNVAWKFWLACEAIRKDLCARAAERLGVPASKLVVWEGRVVDARDETVSVSIYELGDGDVVELDVERDREVADRRYEDRELRNVEGRKIVTGEMQYAADVMLDDMVYGGFMMPEHHSLLTNVVSLDREALRSAPGVLDTGKARGRGHTFVTTRSFRDLQRARYAADVDWRVPARRQRYDPREELVTYGSLEEVVEDEGDALGMLESCERVLDEEYLTHHVTHAALETDSAVATYEDDRIEIWTGSQYPYMAREIAAQRTGLPEEKITVHGLQVGGGFGGKISNEVGPEAAAIAQKVGRPVKCVYSREEQFKRPGRAREIVVARLRSGIDDDGRIVARHVDLHGDRGMGTRNVYDVPHTLTRLYAAKMPVLYAAVRGTSYVQTGFALESHVDELAKVAGLDPLEFRLRNIADPRARDTLEKAAEIFGYDGPSDRPDHGIGMGITYHGGSQYGSALVEARVDPRTHETRILRVAFVCDIGTVINHRLTRLGIQGAIFWAIGFMLEEELEVDGHSVHTSGFYNYDVPRFEDMPDEIEIGFLRDAVGEPPRGVGEMPMIPTLGAIANAVADATGIRFRQTPLTPERIRAARSARS